MNHLKNCMDHTKVISIIEARSLKPSSRNKCITKNTESIVIHMRELHEAAVAIGKPTLLANFLSDLSNIAIAWWCEDKEKKERNGKR